MKKEKEHSRIAIVIGTKAELIKCVPIMIELQKRNKDYHFIHTGQHPLGEASKKFGVKSPDFILSKEPEKSTKFWSKVNKSSAIWAILMVFRVKRVLKRIRPKYVIYHGDTMSTAAAAIGSSRLLNPKANWKNVHLEAGLRSGSIFEPFPEEISRQISDSFSHILFAVSSFSEDNLSKKYSKRKSKEVFNVGNTIVDVAHFGLEKSGKKNKEKDFALINIHRHENLVNKKRMENIVEILKSINIKALWPLHDNTEMYLKKYGLMEEVLKNKNIKITPLKDYFEFVELISKCKYLVTDGGSIQEESLVFKKPCVILRKRTERQEGLSTGINFLTNLDVDKTKEIIKQIEEGKIKPKNYKNPYGEKGLTKKIVDILDR